MKGWEGGRERNNYATISIVLIISSELKGQSIRLEIVCYSLYINAYPPETRRAVNVAVKCMCGHCKEPCLHVSMLDCTKNQEEIALERHKKAMFLITSLDCLLGEFWSRENQKLLALICGVAPWVTCNLHTRNAQVDSIRQACSAVNTAASVWPAVKQGLHIYSSYISRSIFQQDRIVPTKICNMAANISGISLHIWNLRIEPKAKRAETKHALK